MPCRWAKYLAACALIGSKGEAQQVTELGGQAVVSLSNPVLGVGGLYGALRASARTRLSGFIAGGTSGGEFAWRAEALGHFLLSPDRRRGWGPYLAGGLAVVGGSREHGYIVLTAGIEEHPAAVSGWALELGVGGGFRLGLGYRWRQFPGGEEIRAPRKVSRGACFSL
jgi:hypothetical protein